MGSPPNSNTPTRRVPPPCWTQQETLALIHAYRDKWFSVNRGNLRSADWDAVAASVAESSLPDLPPKSSIQCRHKVEKLRKRYRMEKKRCLDYPGRFFSSWNLFPLLDSIFVGSSAAASSKRCRIQSVDGNNATGDGFRVKMSRDRYLVKKCSNVDGGFDPDVDLGLDQDLAFMARKYSNGDYDGDVAGGGDLGSGFCMKNSVGDMNSVSVAFRPNDYGRVINGKLNSDIGFHCDYLKMENPKGPRLKACGKFSSDDSCPNYRTVGENIDAYSGFPLKTLGNVPTGFNPKFYRKTDDVRNSNSKFGYDAHCRSDDRDGFGENVIVNGLVSPLPPPPGFRQKSYCKIDGSPKLDVNSNVLNGIGNMKKSGIDDSSIKKVTDPIAELVSAVRLYTKNFVKVEKMKMEMAMELEKMRMEAMLKHNKMILDSQQQILEAFSQTALEKKKKRKEMEVLSPYPDKNEETQVVAADCESIGKSGIAKEECEGCFN